MKEEATLLSILQDSMIEEDDGVLTILTVSITIRGSLYGWEFSRKS